MLVVQSLWWAARNVAWFRYPILIPIVVIIAALSGLTPTIIADNIMELVFTPFKALGKWVSRLSYTWLDDPWLWILPLIILAICGLFRLSPAGLEPESEDSPMMRKQAPISLPPLVTQSDPKPPVLHAPRCTAFLIRCHGDPTKPLISAPCPENGSFLIPLADGDTTADTIGDTDDSLPRPFPAALVCAKHATLYRTHVHQCTCSTPKCQTIGLPFHGGSEVFYECVHHSAERVIKDQIPTALAKRAKAPGTRTPPDSPPMPSLEPITIPSGSMRLSGSSGSISTGISLGELPVKMRELGGRAKDTPPPLADPQPEQDCQPLLCLRDRPRSRERSCDARRTSSPKKHRSTRARTPSSSSRTSSDAISSGSSSDSSRSPSPKKRRKSTRRKKSYRRHSSSRSRRSHSSKRKLSPRGLTFSRPTITRSPVRHHSTSGPAPPKDHHEAMVDRLGAMAEKDERKAGAPSKVEQLAVCALRGFGLHKITMGTNTYGPELESCLRRQARPERDRLWHAKLRIPITNRIAKAATSGLFGNVASGGTDEISATLGDCIAMDASRYRSHRWGGEKIEPSNKEPQTMACFVGAVKQQIKLFCLLYGEEHKCERKKALKHLAWLHGQKPRIVHRCIFGGIVEQNTL